MELLHAQLFPGLSINIQRSNGLIHSANVSTVNLKKSCVSVEWTKGGTAKGKEIDIDDVAAINPELLHLLPLHSKDSLPLQENVTILKQKCQSVNSKVPAPREGLRSHSTHMSTVSEVRIPARENEMEWRWGYLCPQTLANIPIPTGHPRPSCSTATELPLLMVSEEAEEQVYTTRSTSSANPGNSVQRKLCIVKEMENMKNKREEKRAQNSELRIKRAQEYDSSFPNWEFAQMIKEFLVTFHRLY